ncbi:SHOCT domain-containing protein [Rhodoferax sp.]|uniref:SHOCT domain-containing protein n=1 Tax=Rhodoferax sp. TaxID=50421 RepID=UPI00271B6198|nr:SHOCT domain-containing protein [Rhodoferax sp.]MDO9196860.1 SHOCT domain-containing protein [Rhodoferax sp.]
MFHDYGYMVGMHAYWWVFWVVVVIAMVFWGRGSSPTRRDRAREAPHEMLRRRLANGDISVEEYEKRKVILDRDTQ